MGTLYILINFTVNLKVLYNRLLFKKSMGEKIRFVIFPIGAKPLG